MNEESAAAALDAINEPVVRNLVELAVAQVRMQFMREAGQTEDEWDSRLPNAPFDMHFFVKVLSQVFAREATIRRILDGQTVAQATGWDV